MSIPCRDGQQMRRLKYSPNLRRMIMQINEYNIACPYKQTFEEHATRALIDCESEFDVFSTSRRRPVYQPLVLDHIEDSHCSAYQTDDSRSTDSYHSSAPEQVCSEPTCKSHQSDPFFDDVTKSDVSVSHCSEDTLSSHHFPFLSKILRSRTLLRQERLQREQDLEGSKNDYKVVASPVALKTEHHSDGVLPDENEKLVYDDDEDNEEPLVPSLTDFYNNMANRLHDPVDNLEVGAWKLCRTFHVPDLDLSLLQKRTRTTSVTGSAPLRRSLRNSTSDRIPFGPSPFVSRAPLTMAQCGLIDTGVKSETKTKRSTKSAKRRKHKEVQEKVHAIINARVAKESAPRAKMAVNMIDAPIEYGLEHHRGHHGYMQQYRNDYTKKKLEHVLLHCAQRYHASREPLVPVPTAAVECNDVRQGACIQPESVKFSEYKFEVCQKFRTHPMIAKPAAPVSPVSVQRASSAEREGNAEEGDEDGGNMSRCSSAASTSSDKDGGSKGNRKDRMMRQLLGQSGSSTSVCRSRPTIPSNSRGIVCATSVETPLHIINKPYLKGLKGKSVVSETVSPLSRKPSSAGKHKSP